MDKLLKKADDIVELLEKKFMPKTVQPALPPMKPTIKPQTMNALPAPNMQANTPGMPNTLKPPRMPRTTGRNPTKMPGVAAAQKKDPKKVAEQIREGTTRFNALEMLKFDKNGQWKLYPPEG
jgi:hypothetical protein